MAELGGSPIEEDAAEGAHFDVLAEVLVSDRDLRLHYRHQYRVITRMYTDRRVRFRCVVG
jgi:hypothetical protein